MRIACPACSATYDVPPDRVPAGRSVRCAKCGGMWAPVPEAALADEPAPAPPVAEAPVPAPPVAAAPVAAPEAERPKADVAVAEPPAPHVAEAMSNDAPALHDLIVAAMAHHAAPESATPLSAGKPASVISERSGGWSESRTIALAGWVLTVLILGAAGWGAVVKRTDIMRAWPNSERAYAAIGLRQ